MSNQTNTTAVETNEELDLVATPIIIDETNFQDAIAIEDEENGCSGNCDDCIPAFIEAADNASFCIGILVEETNNTLKKLGINKLDDIYQSMFSDIFNRTVEEYNSNMDTEISIF